MVIGIAEIRVAPGAGCGDGPVKSFRPFRPGEMPLFVQLQDQGKRLRLPGLPEHGTLLVQGYSSQGFEIGGLHKRLSYLSGSM